MPNRWPGIQRKLLVGALGTIAAFLLLLAISHPYDSIQHARENVPRQDLRVIRNAIDQYTLDKQKAPQTLQDLVDAGYLREIPKDPITLDRDWEPVLEDPSLAVDPTQVGVDDVHSRSTKRARNGTAYNTW